MYDIWWIVWLIRALLQIQQLKYTAGEILGIQLLTAVYVYKRVMYINLSSKFSKLKLWLILMKFMLAKSFYSLISLALLFEHQCQERFSIKDIPSNCNN